MKWRMELSEEEKVSKDLLKLYSHSFEKVWSELSSNAGSDVEITPELLDFYQKMLQCLRIVPSVYVQLATGVFRLVNNGKSLPRGTDPEKSLQPLLKLLTLLNEMLDWLTLPQQKTLETGELQKESAILYISLMEIVLSKCHCSQLEKAEYVRLLLTCRKIALFSKPDFNPDLEGNFLTLVETGKAELFLRFFVEIYSEVDGAGGWSGAVFRMIEKESPDYLNILGIILEKDVKLLDVSLLAEIRKSLTNEKKKKVGSNLLKLIVKSVSENETNFTDKNLRKELMLEKGRESCLNFWSDFFALYEILDEKQSHIIQPVLKKKAAIFECESQFVFVLIGKMLRHDNRAISKGGFNTFLTQQNYSQFLKEFLEVEVFPFLRDYVGWILTEGEEFMEGIVGLKKVLEGVYGSELNEKVLGFLVEDGRCFSPVAVYFFVRCLSKVRVLNEKQVQLVVRCLLHGLGTVGRFVRAEVERDFVCLVSIGGGGFSQGNKLVEDFLGALTAGSLKDSTIRDKLVGLVRDCTDVEEVEYSKGYYRYKWLNGEELDCIKVVGDILKGEDWSRGSDSLKDYLELSGVGLSVRNSLVREVCEDLFGLKCDLETCKKVALIEIDGARSDEKMDSFFATFLKLENSKSSLDLFVFWKLLSIYGFVKGSLEMEKLVDLFVLEINFKKDLLINYKEIFKSKLNADYYNVKLNGLSRALEGSLISLIIRGDYFTLWKRCIETAIDHVEMSGFGGVVGGLRFFKSVGYFLDVGGGGNGYDDEDEERENKDLEGKCKESLVQWMDLAWDLVFEMRKTDMFWVGIRQFVELVTDPYFVGCGVLTKYADKLFENGETINGLPLILVEKLCERILVNGDYVYFVNGMEEILSVCFRGVDFGPAVPKNVRVLYGLWEHLNKGNTEDVQDPSNFSWNAKTRLLSINLITEIHKRLQTTEKILEEETRLDAVDKMSSLIMKQILDWLSVPSKRYFASSVMHRRKQRQGLGILSFLFCGDEEQQFFSREEDVELILEKLLDSLADESPQPSVRYITELIIVKILDGFWSLWDVFFEKAEQCWRNKRIGFGSFFCSICLHASEFLIGKEDLDPSVVLFFEKTFKDFAELIVGSHTTVRVYAQVCFVKMYERLENTKSESFLEILKEYKVIYVSLKITVGSTTGGNNAGKLLEAVGERDFYLNSFSPVKHFTKEVLFIYLPRLSGMASDEFPLESDLKHLKFFNSSSTTTEELRELMKNEDSTVWHLKNGGVEGRELGEMEPLTITPPEQTSIDPLKERSNYQKKVNPWKTFSISSSSEDSQEIKKRTSVEEEGLIVVASLIDKIPNLGGLCRSCEIFGVSKYVLPSFKLLEDSQFVSLSVSSHHWVDLIEVPPRDLESFLGTYAGKGYSIIGIEQAEQSTMLNQFVFPKKAVLLLGNEKYGIPMNLLHLVDKCLEIPQVGVIRSLNVHVSGALCIWQYAQQHQLL